MKVAVLFDRFGPYHIARLEAAAKYVEVIPMEVSGETNEYQWDKVESNSIAKPHYLICQPRQPRNIHRRSSLKPLPKN